MKKHPRARNQRSNDSSERPAKKRFGQNFLVDATALRRIVSAAEITPADNVLEIGPGRGALTELLLAQASSVTAVEIDRDLHGILKDRFQTHENFRLIEGDILTADLTSITATKVIGNLPYNISTPILSRLIDFRENYERLVLMFQREVVDRITAAPGTPGRGYLSIIAQAAFDIERVIDLPPSSFRPSPKVWSSVAMLVPKARSEFDEAGFRRLLSTAFQHKRKTLSNNLLAKYPSLLGSAIDLSRRAESLSLDEWSVLFTRSKKNEAEAS